jgi:prepilin-type N-terminal cleavage/methylation domain-containing protein
VLAPENLYHCFTRSPRNKAHAFTLTELLVVIGIFSILMVASGPAVRGFKSSADFSTAVNKTAAVLKQARSHAMTKNTYVWVGFYEENTTATSPTNSTAPYQGTGRVILSMVASKNGTRIFDESATSGELTLSNVTPLSENIKLENVHLQDIGAPQGGDSSRLDGRPAGAYSGEDSAAKRISSTDGAATPFPVKIGEYKFYKTVRFSPSGEASINGADGPQRLNEIGLMPTNGTRVAEDNFAAVQFSGLSGNVQIYRQ